MSLKEKFYITLVAAIFIAGLVIYGWNLLHGRNVSESPKIDFSQFEFKIGNDDGFSQKK